MDFFPTKDLRKGDLEKNHVSLKGPAGHLSRIHMGWNKTYE